MEGNERSIDTVETQENSAERTFTQDEVNEIIRNRLAREREKTGASSGSDREKDLADRELRLMAREKLFDKGMPLSLADVLRYDNEKSLEKAIDEIKKLVQAPSAEEQKTPKTWGQRQGSMKANKDPYRAAMGLQ